MGSFAWDVAQGSPINITETVYPGRWVKVLIPNSLGGGCVVGRYTNYGAVITPSGMEFDLMEWVGLWNTQPHENNDDDLCPKVSSETPWRRETGIELSYSGEELEFPLKMIDLMAKGSYEDFGPSYLSENQGYPEQKLDDEEQFTRFYHEALKKVLGKNYHMF